MLGLGAGDLQLLPLGIYHELKKADQLYLRTKEHPVVSELEQEGLLYHSFDEIYLKHEQFDLVYDEIVSYLIQQAKNVGEIHYAVPGHPTVAEKTVQLLFEKSLAEGFEVELLGGQSFIDPLLGRLKVDPVEGLSFLDATSLSSDMLNPKCHTIITQVYDAMIASEVKLTLMEVYPDDYPVTIATAVGMQSEQIDEVPLFELDRATTLSNLTALFISKTTEEKILNRQFNRSREIFRILRGPDGCPWDKKQTHQTLKKYLLEEANEVLEAIEQEDIELLIEELGDLLLQVFLHAQIGEDEGMFNMEDVIQSLNEKMIRRHPHVFGEQSVKDANEVVQQWEEIKKEEKLHKEKNRKK